MKYSEYASFELEAQICFFTYNNPTWNPIIQTKPNDAKKVKISNGIPVGY